MKDISLASVLPHRNMYPHAYTHSYTQNKSTQIKMKPSQRIHAQPSEKKEMKEKERKKFFKVYLDS